MKNIVITSTLRSRHMKRNSLSDLEQEVMNILWNIKSGSVRDVLTQLSKQRKYAYTTVMTILGRMVEKGVITRKLEGNGFIYFPKLSKENFIAKSVHSVFSSTVAAFGQESVSYFAKEIQSLNPKRRKELLKLLKEPK